MSRLLSKDSANIYRVMTALSKGVAGTQYYQRRKFLTKDFESLTQGQMGGSDLHDHGFERIKAQKSMRDEAFPQPMLPKLKYTPTLI